MTDPVDKAWTADRINPRRHARLAQLATPAPALPLPGSAPVVSDDAVKALWNSVARAGRRFD